MSRIEARFAGFGGQGILFAGITLGRAACLYAGKHATQTQSYGTEARGGASRCDVVIDDVEVDYPGVTSPDIFVAFSQEAYDKLSGGLKPGGKLFYDPELVNPDKREGVELHSVPATRSAMDELGDKLVANVVMLGAVITASGVIDMEILKRCLRETTPARRLETNLKALDLGAALVA
ncbi:MAG TPA: 2-oxoacid:acceptor oxidoreductase family protein [Chloroflexota bacterium]|nr:2-oxoacid:acceptor oxidoreductase family protein [Chloroflexota bacterium]